MSHCDDMLKNLFGSEGEEHISNPHATLFDKIPDKKFAEYVVKTSQKTVKKEDSLIRLILYASLSAYTNDPLNLGIIAPTSEGKTYAVSEVLSFLPKHDIWLIGSMSPKVLIRNRGILVDENNEPIEEKLQNIKDKIDIEKDTQIKRELESQLREISNNSKILIDLREKVLVFLEPPHLETWNVLKPILSHDSFEIEHPYVDKIDRIGTTVKHIVTRGWPACIFCSAKDESDWTVWPEIQSRFFITSPNMIKQKYEESNILIGQTRGYPSLVQEQLIISPEEVQLAKDCILLIKEELKKNYSDNAWIPYNNILSQSLPSEKGPDVRTTKRIFSLLALIAKINSFNRHKLVFGKETLSISSLEDLGEVLNLVQNITGIPSYKLKFFIDIFVPLFLSKVNPEEKEGIVEDKKAVYTNELAEFYREKYGKSITNDNIKKTYLMELKNNGLIDEFDSKIDKRRKGYYPIVDLNQFQKNKNYTNTKENDNKLQFFKLKLSKNYNKIDKNWLKLEILDLLKYGIGKVNEFKLLENNNETCICQFIEKYHLSGSLIRYFDYDENGVYSSKIFGKIIKL